LTDVDFWRIGAGVMFDNTGNQGTAVNMIEPEIVLTAELS